MRSNTINELNNFDSYVEGTYYERFCTKIQRVDDEDAIIFGGEPSCMMRLN